MTAAIQETDTKSATSYKSTQSSRSGVLERARQYSRKMDQDGKRAKSLERETANEDTNADNTDHDTNPSPRSQSAGRPSGNGNGNGNGNRVSTRERALQSVGVGAYPSASPKESIAVSPAQHARRNVRTLPTTSPAASTNVTRETNMSRTSKQQQSTSVPPTNDDNDNDGNDDDEDDEQEREHQAIVTPELLVDALSGHEDGLLAIAERLMEHYDAGYDVMGEAIIDAFADVQKLFQHVVEAAHMEGAAFEASRREEEIQQLRQQVAQNTNLNSNMEQPPTPQAASPSGAPTRHDEFIDQDVKDCLSLAIREGASFREKNKHQDCYVLYEHACQNASSLLPVDSDHRGRIQLSIARAESMSPDRACAILRYAMDDVLRSGLRAGKGGAIMPDPSKRADVVLSKPKGHPSMNGSTGQSGVVQSGEEALASLIEEMKEILGAPVYDDAPLQSVAQRFWGALGDAQKTQLRNEERLEQHLGKLKGDFLLSRAVRTILCYTILYYCIYCWGFWGLCLHMHACVCARVYGLLVSS